MNNYKPIFFREAVKRRKNKMRDESIASCVVLLFILVLMFIPSLINANHISTEVIVVNNLERIPKSGELVYTNTEVFSNDDSWLKGKFNSDDYHVYLDKHKGEELTVDLQGYRIPLISLHRNILRVHGWDGRLK